MASLLIPGGGVTIRDTKWNDSKWKIEIPANASLRGVIKFIEDNYGWFEALVDATLGGVDVTEVEDPEMKKYLKALNAWAMDSEELPALRQIGAKDFLENDISLDHLIPDSCYDSCMDLVEVEYGEYVPDNAIVTGVRNYLEARVAEYKERVRKGDKHE